MRGSINTILRKLSVVLLFCIMGIMMVNKTVYTHFHILHDGKVVTHAHPFSKGSENKQGKTHQHTNLEIYLLDLVSRLFIMALTSLGLAVFFLAENNYFLSIRTVSVHPIRIYSGRAPPAGM